MTTSRLPQRIVAAFHQAIEDYVDQHTLWVPWLEWVTGPDLLIHVVVRLNDGRARKIWIGKTDVGVSVMTCDLAPGEGKLR